MGIERYCDDSGNHRSISKAKSAWRCDPQKDYENIFVLIWWSAECHRQWRHWSVEKLLHRLIL